MPLDPREDLLAVDLAHHHMQATHARHGVGHAPPVAVEHREGVHEDVTVAHAGVPAEGHRVDPAVAVRELHPLGACGRTRGVVHRARVVLVPRPLQHVRARCGRSEELGVVDTVEGEAVLQRNIGHHVGEVGVVQEDGRPGVLDDVGDLGRRKTEVDRDEDAAESAHTEVRREEPAGVRADDGDPLPRRDTEMLQAQRHPTRPCLELGVGDGTERARHIRFVDHCRAGPVHRRRPVEKVRHRQRDTHRYPLPSRLLPPNLRDPTALGAERTEPGRRAEVAPPSRSGPAPDAARTASRGPPLPPRSGRAPRPPTRPAGAPAWSSRRWEP